MSEIEILPSRSGPPTLLVDGVCLHSRYDPVKEAKREVDGIKERNPSLLVVLGMGLGYSAEQALKGFPTARLMVIEADERIFQAAREQGRVFEDPRITYLHGLSVAETFREMKDVIGPACSLSYSFLPRLADRNSQYYSAIAREIGRIVEMHQEGLKTARRFGMLWWENTVRNLSAVMKAHDISDWDMHGEPVVIFAAGPSLEDDLEFFAAVEGGYRFVVDTAYSAVRSAGIRVDAVFSVDAQDKTLEHFRSYAPENLIAAPIVPPPIFGMSSAAAVVSTDGALSDWIDAIRGRPLIRLRSGGTVTSIAFGLARRLRPGRIVLAGVDFAYRSGRKHSRSIYEEDSLAALDRFRSLEEKFFASATRTDSGYKTENNLLQYARWMKWELSETDVPVCRVRDFGLLTDVPVIENNELAKLLSAAPAPLPWAPSMSDEAVAGRLAGKLRDERKSLVRALHEFPAGIQTLSGCFEPIIHPFAVKSQSEKLSSDELEILRSELGYAEQVLDEVIASL